MNSILGISAFYHDSAACILVDGKIIAAAQEERFTRIKHYSGFPVNSIKFCLKKAGVSLELLPVWYDVDFPEDLKFLKTHLELITQSGLCEVGKTKKILDEISF